MCRETSTLLEGGGGLLIQALLSIMLQNLFQRFWPGLPLEIFFKRLLVVSKTKKHQFGGKADSFHFFKAVYCNMH